jgi:DNA adenine methylase
MIQQQIHTPLLKWPGGKSWLAPKLSQIFRVELAQGATYHEPFLGSAATFLSLQPNQAVLSDINSHLIEFYLCIRDHFDEVLNLVWRYSNTSECYYRIRKMKPQTTIGRAARFLFLNRTCWGGIYRLNKKGEFNVPFGNSGRIICRKKNVLSVSSALTKATIVCSDFEDIITKASRGDVLYADPPYTTLGQNNGFLRYNERLFRWSDQRRLAHCCIEAADRGVFVAVSGLWHPDILTLYPGWQVWKIQRKSCVSRLVESRYAIYEVVLFNKMPTSHIVT